MIIIWPAWPIHLRTCMPPHKPCGAKVRDLDMIVMGQQDVLGFHIPRKGVDVQHCKCAFYTQHTAVLDNTQHTVMVAQWSGMQGSKKKSGNLNF